MKEFVVYILYSEKYDKSYTGYTSDLISSFRSYNQLATKGFTIRYRPWKVVYLEFLETKKEALVREKNLKSSKGREWIKDKLTK
ncbi:GIY-YIG nuclease family protein [uncultured Aquimarina sp.]|uniref:GIY-YIG nuclease family protein n=1 Tax=uncultured Aquimarina sp. TaxID=575652 RepID=UPI002633963B|nr:GIY-YIG nuclease family protein [uncultured Aquimarina sp.]